MTLAGSAFLALWNDVDAARDAEYNQWHTFEHVPERVAIEGFLSGRRYVARERSRDRYFTLYELESLSALQGSGYADVVSSPTAWSRSMRPALRNFLRHPCSTVFTLGRGRGAGIATFRFSVREPIADPEALWATLAPFPETAGIVSLHLGRAERDPAFPLKNETSASVDRETTDYVLLVESIDRAALEEAAARIAEAVGRAPSTANPSWHTFDLAFAIDRSAPTARTKQ